MKIDASTAEHIRQAAARIAPHVRRTAAIPAAVSGPSRQLWLKPELFQPGGSFKVRGVFNKVLQLDETRLRRGVVSMSAGNHAIALALAARSVGVPATIVMPAGASRAKVTATRALGADVVLTDEPLVEKMQEIREAGGLELIHPFEDLQVIYGASTVGLELVEDVQGLDAVFVPVGGGGLIAGITLAVKAFAPQTRVIGVEPTGANAMHEALASDGSKRPDSQATVADGLTAPYAGAVPLEIVRDYVDEMMSVDEEEIGAAFREMYQSHKLACEPSGAVGLAAANKWAANHPDRVVATVVSGGNVDPSVVTSLLGQE